MKLLIDDERAKAIRDGLPNASLGYLTSCVERLLADRGEMQAEIERLRAALRVVRDGASDDDGKPNPRYGFFWRTAEQALEGGGE